MSVKRYQPAPFTERVLHASDDGKYVKHDDYAALEAKFSELAAENAGIKAAIDATIGWQQSTDPENVESVRMLVDVKTPSTDAFLAEVRAQGVEMFAKEMHADISGDDARELAAQLRKGVQS